jgi:hypothetical protein
MLPRTRRKTMARQSTIEKTLHVPSSGPAGSFPCRQTTNRLLSRHWYASSCTPRTARPLGSLRCLNDSSQARASAVEHATEGTLGTQRAALSLGNARQRWSGSSIPPCSAAYGWGTAPRHAPSARRSQPPPSFP